MGSSYVFALRYATQITLDIKIRAKHLPVGEIAFISKVVSKLSDDVSLVWLLPRHIDNLRGLICNGECEGGVNWF